MQAFVLLSTKRGPDPTKPRTSLIRPPKPKKLKHMLNLPGTFFTYSLMGKNLLIKGN